MSRLVKVVATQADATAIAADGSSPEFRRSHFVNAFLVPIKCSEQAVKPTVLVAEVVLQRFMRNPVLLRGAIDRQREANSVVSSVPCGSRCRDVGQFKSPVQFRGNPNVRQQ